MVSLRELFSGPDVQRGASSRSGERLGNTELMERLAPMGMRIPPAEGTEDLLRAYQTSAAVRQVVGRIASMTTRIPWTLEQAKSKTSGKAIRVRSYQLANIHDRKKLRREIAVDADLKPILDHPLLDLLAGGCEKVNGWSVWELVQVYLDLPGECGLFKERDSLLGTPIGLWPIPPTWFVKFPSPSKPWYTVKIGVTDVDIDPTDIVYISHPNPSNPYRRGTGIGQSLGHKIQTERYVAEHLKASFYNGAKVDTIISAADMSKEDTTRLETDWRNRFRKYWNRVVPYFLNWDVKVHKLGSDHKESDALAIDEATRRVIRQVYGVPPEIFGITESSNRATSDVADHIMAKYVTDPRKDYLRLCLQEQLVPDFDERIILGYISPIQQDWEMLLKISQAAPWARDVDEWRELQGLDPMDGNKGKVRVMKVGDRIVDELEPAEVPEPLAPGEDPEVEDDLEDDAKPTTDEDSEPGATEDKPEDEAKGKRRRKAVTKGGRIDEIIESVRSSEVEKELMPLVAEVIENFGVQMVDQFDLGIVFNVQSAEVQDYLATRSATKVKDISDTTRRKLRKTLEAGQAAGEDTQKLADRIHSTFRTARGARANTIARTEVGSAMNAGHLSAINQAEVGHKEWWAALDERTRSLHIELHAQTVATNQPFVDAEGSEAQYPGDFGEASKDCNCRCIVLPFFGTKAMMDIEAKDLFQKAADDGRTAYEAQVRSAMRRAFNEQERAALDALQRTGA